MAQHANEPLASVALEEISILVLPSLALPSATSLFVHAFHFRVHDDPLLTPRNRWTLADLKPVTESVAVTTVDMGF